MKATYYLVCGRTALAIYRSQADGERLARLLHQEAMGMRVASRMLPEDARPKAPGKRIACALSVMLDTPLPIEALVVEPASRRQSAYTRTILDSDPFHALSCIHFENDIFVASPELVYYQLTRGRDIATSWMLGSELCGRYALDSDAKDGMHDRPPLTTPEALDRFFARSHMPCSHAAGKRILPYLKAGARSPKEAEIAALMALPRRMGGRGIPGVTLNRTIALTPEAARVAKRSHLEGDAYLETIDENVEYDSDAHHLSREAHERDERKANALRMMGVNLTTITAGQLNSWSAIDAILDGLSRKGGFHKRLETPDIKQAQQHLWRELLSGRARI